MRNVETVKKPLEVQSRMAHNEDLNSPSQEVGSGRTGHGFLGEQ